MREAAEAVAILLSLVAPYTAEEMWERLGHQPTVARAGWPVVDEALLVEDSVTAVVQVQGKLRARLEVSPDISEADLEAAALADEAVQRALEGKQVRKVIVRAPKLVNVVVGLRSESTAATAGAAYGRRPEGVADADCDGRGCAGRLCVDGIREATLAKVETLMADPPYGRPTWSCSPRPSCRVRRSGSTRGRSGTGTRSGSRCSRTRPSWYPSATTDGSGQRRGRRRLSGDRDRRTRADGKTIYNTLLYFDPEGACSASTAS